MFWTCIRTRDYIASLHLFKFSYRHINIHYCHYIYLNPISFLPLTMFKKNLYYGYHMAVLGHYYIQYHSIPVTVLRLYWRLVTIYNFFNGRILIFMYTHLLIENNDTHLFSTWWWDDLSIICMNFICNIHNSNHTTVVNSIFVLFKLFVVLTHF